MVTFAELDPVIHSRIRLSILSILISAKEADFVYLKEATGATDGNLSAHLSKLEEVGYIKIVKSYAGKKPRTTCSMTADGINAFANYTQTLEKLIHLAQEEQSNAQG
jgi:DNA-binding MarR family transcriptional regulator